MRSCCVLFMAIALLIPSMSIVAEETESKSDYGAMARDNWQAFCAKLNNPDHPVRIAFLGDSITEKNFHTHDKANYVDYAECYFTARNPRALIINAGKSGDTTPKAIMRMKQAVLDHKPDLTFVMLGINDCSSWFNVPFDDYTTLMKQIIETLLQAQSAVVVITQN